MKRIAFTITFLALLLMVGFLLINRDSERLAFHTHERYLKVADVNSGYEVLFGNLNTMRDSLGEKSRYCINASYRRDCTNVIIVDLSRASKEMKAERFPFISLRKNALALSPNVILIDKVLIQHLLFEAYNLLSAVTRASLREDHSTADVGTEFALASLINMEVVRTKQIPAEVFGNARSLESFSTELLRGLSEGTPGPNAKTTSVHKLSTTDLYMMLTLALLLDHESAHLDVSDGAHEHESNGLLLDQTAARLTLREEIRADKIALGAMERYIGMLRMSSNLETSTLFKDPIYSSLPFLVQAEYWRDSAITAGLDGFRGFSADDMAVEISHQSCDEEDPEQLVFLDPRTVIVGRRKPLPLLTKQEFELQQTNFVRADLPQTHLHNLSRAENIYRQLHRSSDSKLEGLQLGGHVAFVQALLAKNPKAAFTESNEFAPISNTSIDKFLEKTKELVDYEPAVTCPLSRCYVGTISGADGYIEIVANKKELAEVRVIMDLGAGLKGTGAEKYIENMLKFLTVLILIAPENTAQILELADLRRGHFACGAASVFYVDEKTGVAFHSTSMRRTGYMQVRAFNIEVVRK